VSVAVSHEHSQARITRQPIPAEADKPIRELVAGLEDVGGVAIPYARLPTRARNAYASEFVCWSDIADHTMDSLLDRPLAGVATVRAVIDAARDAVAKHKAAATAERVGAAAATQRLLAELDERERAMLSARLWAQRPQSQEVIAQRLGIAYAWVNRNQPRAEAKFLELIADPLHQETSEHAAALARRLGPYVPAEVVVAELRRLNLDPDDEAAHVLLHLAGPYVQRGEWFENRATHGEHQVAAAVDAVFARNPAPTTEELPHALTAIGMPTDVAVTYLQSREDWRCFGDVWVRWGDSAARKVEAVLHVLGAPATPEDIFAEIGTGPTTLKALREALYADQRFVRASRQSWGLRIWGIDEYAGIPELLGARIDAAGGTMHVDDLISEMLSRFPDVAESSIRTNLNSLAFIIDETTVRRRTDADAWPPIPPLYSARGAFRRGDNEIRWALPVNAHVLRGSGQPIPSAVANALGVTPGQRRVFTNPHGTVAVIWRLSSTNGPSIGSLRAPTKAVGAEHMDTVVLAFNLHDDSLDVQRIGPEVGGAARLRLLLGRTVRNPGTALATSLGCRRADVAAVLRERGDDDLADLV
jgi:hypothetical protein